MCLTWISWANLSASSLVMVGALLLLNNSLKLHIAQQFCLLELRRDQLTLKDVENMSKIFLLLLVAVGSNVSQLFSSLKA